ncbi:hypothetical protein NDU88_005695 [Pleurodeles waltl]|uniref:Uncharacterized protein n=1 Tax=Pleurodeles waltl TaxID=8319 RepID=A0AAV7UK89_PLEWA|nr:hypothetical protein NDU88_005695 [Pleurodeles waltl]
MPDSLEDRSLVKTFTMAAPIEVLDLIVIIDLDDEKKIRREEVELESFVQHHEQQAYKGFHPDLQIIQRLVNPVIKRVQRWHVENARLVPAEFAFGSEQQVVHHFDTGGRAMPKDAMEKKARVENPASVRAPSRHRSDERVGSGAIDPTTREWLS